MSDRSGSTESTQNTDCASSFCSESDRLFTSVKYFVFRNFSSKHLFSKATYIWAVWGQRSSIICLPKPTMAKCSWELKIRIRSDWSMEQRNNYAKILVGQASKSTRVQSLADSTGHTYRANDWIFIGERWKRCWKMAQHITVSAQKGDWNCCERNSLKHVKHQNTTIDADI